MTDRVSYELGDGVFEPFNARLLHGGEVIPLTAKAADTLAALARQPNVLVSKDALMAEVWPGIAVEENNLNQQISALRKVLGSHLGVSIETVPRRGYRLAGSVRVLAPAAEPVATGAAPIPTPVPATARAYRWRVATPAAVLGLAVAVSLSGARAPSSPPSPGPDTEARRESNVFVDRAEELRRYGNNRAAVAELREAIRVDPTNAHAYSILAFALQAADRGSPAMAVRPEGGSPSVDAARRGVEIDPQCAPCRGTYAFFLFYHDWRFREAEAQFRESLRLDPANSSARPAYAMLLAVTGRPEAAIEQVDIGLASDPYQVSWLEIRASALYFARRYDDAIATADRALAITSTHRPAWDWRSKALFQLGRDREALHALAQVLLAEHARELERAVDREGPAGGLRVALGVTDDWRGKVEHAWRRAGWRMRLGDSDGALDELERAHEARRFNAINLGADPMYDAIRQHPRFRKLLTAMDLAPWFPLQ